MANEKLLGNGTPPNETPYLLYYRQGANPHPQFFVFFHPSPPSEIRKVVDRVKKHCELMQLRFVNVRPLVTNLDEAELKAIGSTASEYAER